MTSPRRKSPRPPLQTTVRLLEWGGRGMLHADLDERRILVDRGLPGELVEATIDRRRRPWRGVVDRALEPAVDRVEPPCPHYLSGCGGCQWQHLGYDAQLTTKRELAQRELARYDVDTSITIVHSSGEPWRYRRTAAIAIGWEAGFRPRGRRGIVEIQDCLISHPLIGRFASAVNRHLRSGCMANYHGKVWLDCTVVGTPTLPSLQVLIQGIPGLTLEANPELPDLAATLHSIQGVSSVSFRHRSGEPFPLVGDVMSLVDVAGRSMYLPAGSFFQTNSEMVDRLLGRLRQEVHGRGIGHAGDIYGGIGTLGLPLASSVERLTLIELDQMAVKAAQRTAHAWGLSNVWFVDKHVERVLPELPALDLAVVDPPRSGLGASVVDALALNRVPRVAYVSCSPPSLARDLAGLQRHGYRVESIELFDFYPQTYHVEALALVTAT